MSWLAIVIDAAIVLLLVVGIAQFRTPRGARAGNGAAAVALAAAVAIVLVRQEVAPWPLVAGTFVFGAAAGVLVAVRVTMIQIPALVAFQHGAGGVAAFLVAFVELARGTAALTTLGRVSALVGLVVGAATFSGSLVASGKLAGRIAQRPAVLPAHSTILAVLGLAVVLMAVAAGVVAGTAALPLLVALVVLSTALGVVFAVRIGGADMPVLISFLNATAGVAAAFVGVVIENRLLIAAGATVASSGSILTAVMCASMNRSLMNVFVGNKAVEPTRAVWPADQDPAPVAPASLGQPLAGISDPRVRAVESLQRASSVIIVPGYGMAQAHAQFAVVALAEQLERQHKRVRFAVHPVAGRMPGHMHVLLAEADADYDKLFEMKDIAADFATTDVALVVGACDVVNPAAIDSQGTPISGMPILPVHEAGAVIVCNLDTRPGYSGVFNTLYQDERAILLFDDAKQTVGKLLAALEENASAPVASVSLGS